MPTLTLHAADNSQPVAWRVVRLAQVVQSAETKALLTNDDWPGALVELVDVEGELTAVWKDDACLAQFSGLIDKAWVDAGEPNTEVDHQTVVQRGLAE